MIAAPIAEALNTSTFVAVSLTSGVTCSRIRFWTSDSTAYQLSADGTNYVTVPANTVLDVEVRQKGGVLFYAKASAGTPDMCVVVERL